MKRQLTFFILLASSLIFQSCENGEPKTFDNTEQGTIRKNDFFKKYSIDEQREDFKLLKKSLEKIHPDLYWHITKEEFEKECKELLNDINGEKTSYQYAFYIRNLFGKIRCAHTGISGLSEEHTEFRENNLLSFPFNIRVIENKLYIKDNFTNDSLFNPGSEILAINGVRTESLLGDYVKKVHVDGFNATAIISRIARHFKMLTEFKFDFPSSYAIEVRSPKGIVITKDAIALGQSEIAEKYEKIYPRRESPSLKIIDSLKTAILTFDTFEDTTWLTFLAPSFKTIKDKNIQNLIIDVRRNGGGYDLYGSNLYSYLAISSYKFYNHLEMRLDSMNEPILKYGFLDTTGLKDYMGKNYLKKMPNGNYIVNKKANSLTDGAPFTPEENNFKGKIFILTSYLTSSGGSEFCSIARFQKRATFIGQETGGGYCGNSSGKMFVLNLPNTKIRVWIPLMRYYEAIDDCQSQGGVKPDYEIKPNTTDLNPNIDREMNFALDLIKKH